MKRNKKVVTEPGKSVTVDDFLRQETNASTSSVASVQGRAKTSKNYKLNAKIYKKSGNCQKLVDNGENNRYKMDMIEDERIKCMEGTENGNLVDNFNMDMTQSLKDMYEDEMELIEKIKNEDFTDAIDLKNLQDSLKDDVKEISTLLDKKTGLLKIKKQTKLPGNNNNENKIKVLSTVTLNLPSTSTGKTNTLGLFFRPHVLYSDSNEKLQNKDKENVLEEIELNIKNEKKERKCINKPVKYKDCETTEKLVTTVENKDLLQKVKPIKTSKKENKRGNNSKKQKRSKRLTRNSSGSDTDVSENISYRESSDSSERYVPEDVDKDVEMCTTEFNENNKTMSVENEELLDHHIQHEVHVDKYVLVKFITEKSTKYYVGKVTKIDGIFVSHKFFKKEE
ncbi:unnamed protein product [Parnassius apollo]|uniref:(apollo) hypothetical protein n=1 Tax=Parnassius apollo TaxID=110799 RepID=A0A8S3WDH0_PARAO|nr:unnamed protein product [Parnassius apollo]